MNKLREFENNYFTSWINFNKLNEKIIIQYEETIVDFYSFAIIYKILNRCYITFQEYNKVKKIIDYYLISIGDIMIEMTIQNFDIGINHLDESMNIQDNKCIVISK